MLSFLVCISVVQVTCLTALSLGLISVGVCHADLTLNVLETMMRLTPDELKDPHARMLALSLGLTFLGRFIHTLDLFFGRVFCVFGLCWVQLPSIISGNLCVRCTS